MSDQAQRLPLQQTLNSLAIQRAQEKINQLGASLPCRVVAVNGSIVTVAFEIQSSQAIPNITIPKAEGPWMRSPTQVGDFGLTVPADVYLGGVSGLGGGTATMTRRNNLSTLVWVPVASTGFSSVDVNKAFVCGPSGAVIQTQDGAVSITVTETEIVFVVGAKTWSFTANGLTGSDGVVFEDHVHGGVQAGGSQTSGPEAP